MLAGLLSSLGRLAATTRGVLKLSTGEPNQPFQLMRFLANFGICAGGGGGGFRSEGQAAGGVQAFDQANRSASVQSYRPPPPR